MDGINFDALSPNACARVLELRAANKVYRCENCGQVIPTQAHRWWAETRMHYRSEPIVCGRLIELPAPVYVKRRGNGWQVGTQDLPGWALVLG